VPLRVVLIGGVVLILAGLAYVLSQPAYEQTGSNYVKPELFSIVLPAGATVCQGPDVVPAKTGRVAMTIGTYGKPGPPVDLVMRNGRVPVDAGGLPAGFKEGNVAFRLRRSTRLDGSPVTCLRNRGGTRVAIAGVNAVINKDAARLNGKPVAARMSLTYTESSKRTGWSRLGDLATRVGQAHDTGSWMFWVAVVLSAAAAGIAVAVVARNGATRS
jgi:hypothetical protein